MPAGPPAEGGAGPSRRPNALLAALLSTVLPGAGQIYTGRKRRGWALLGITAAAAVPAVWWLAAAYFGDGLLDAALSLTPGRLILLTVADAVLLGWRAFAAASASAVSCASSGRASHTVMNGAVSVSP